MLIKKCFIGDNFGGDDCTRCTFNFICPDYLDLPLCASSRKVCTAKNVENLNPKYQIYSTDGNLQCKFSAYDANGVLICQAFNQKK